MKTLREIRILAARIVAASPRRVAFSIALMVALTFTEGVGLLLLVPLLELVNIGDQTMPNIAGWFDALFRGIGLRPTLASVLVLFVAVAGLRMLLQRAQASQHAAVREDFTTALRGRLYQAIAGAQWRFLLTRRSSEFTHVLGSEIGQVGLAAFQMIDLAVTLAVAVVYILMAVHIAPMMAGLVLASAGLLAWGARGAIGRARASGVRASSTRHDLHAAIAEHIGGMKVTKSYGAVRRHTEVFSQLSLQLRDASVQVAAGENQLQQALEFSSMALLAIIVFVAAQVLYVPAPQLLVLLFIFARLMPRLVAGYRRVQTLAGALPSFAVVTRLEEECLAAAEPEASDGPDVPLGREVRFDGVTFAYLGREGQPAVRDLDLTIEAGATTAVVGSSGAGKSTIADLLIGLLPPTAGRILVDGEPLTATRLAGWRRDIGYIPQETFLFHGTIRANLVWAAPPATEAELWRALRLAASDEFVARLPEGLDSLIGERGILLSGGERQRLSLARAILRRPRILVLDEATSSLDSENELRIQRAIESLHQQMTIVIVTHRLSTVREADVIYVLEHGSVVESGSWNVLHQRRGRFVELCRAQGIVSGAEAALPVGAVDSRRAAISR